MRPRVGCADKANERFIVIMPVCATMHSENGVSAPTIQRWLGRADLATTLRYLAFHRRKRERVTHGTPLPPEVRRIFQLR